MDLTAGDVIDKKYEVTSSVPLGRGGMGVVYAARRRDTGTPVAVKLLHASLVAKPDIASRFLHEASVGMRMKSLHVARIYDAGTHERIPFMVMEYLEGVDLGVLLDKEGPLSLPRSADLMLQACEALQEAHALEIVHRDLKPQNLFITKGPDELKVLDLGISKSPFAEPTARTATHAVLGSPHYMAPEQITASSKVDARADVWSLGVLLYQLLADTVPFPGKSIPDVHQAIRNGQWTKLRDQCEDLPREVDDLVTRALEPNREERLPSVLAFATALAPFGGAVAKEALARMERVEAHNSGVRAIPPAVADVTLLDAATLVDPPGPAARPVQLASAARTAFGDATLVDRRAPLLPPALKKPAAAASSRLRWMVATTLVVSVGVPGAAWVFRSRQTAAPEVTAPTSSASASSSASAVVAAAAPPVPSSPPSASAEAAPSVVPTPPRAKPVCTGTASADCEAACKADVRACEPLAIALAHGRGAPRNTTRAAELYMLACDAGSMSACSSAGAIYALGDGVRQNDDKAVELYSRACNGGYQVGCVNLGGIYFDDPGPRRDEKRGAELFLRACDAGEKLGCKNVGIAYRTGRGFAQNERQAREYEAKSRGGH